MLYFSVQIYWTNRCLSYRSIDMTDTVMRYMNLGCSAGDACIHLDSVMFRNVRIQKKMTCCRSFQSRKKVTKCFYDLPGSFFRKKFSSSFQKKTCASHLTPHRQVFSYQMICEYIQGKKVAQNGVKCVVGFTPELFL